MGKSYASQYANLGSLLENENIIVKMLKIYF